MANEDTACALAAAIVDRTKEQSRVEAIATVLRALNTLMLGVKVVEEGAVPRDYEALLALETVVRDDPAEWRAEPVKLALARITHARK